MEENYKTLFVKESGTGDIQERKKFVGEMLEQAGALEAKTTWVERMCDTKSVFPVELIYDAVFQESEEHLISADRRRLLSSLREKALAVGCNNDTLEDIDFELGIR